uniref:type VI secretion system amidase effector protein Tae4 n=1 Tax=unclassified Variovorax TaxID=663243 RepID=UPI000D39FEC9
MTEPLKQSSQIRTNARSQSICNIPVPAVTFSALWKSYPGSPPYIDPKTGDPPKGYEDQCAMKTSVAIHGAGIEMKSFNGATVNVNGKKLAIRAEELGSWLAQQPFCGLPRKPENVTGKDWQKTIPKRTGIVFFKDYWLRKGEKAPSGDHIDLWDGSSLSPGWGSFYRFTLGFRSSWIFDLSDLGESREILFWEIK